MAHNALIDRSRFLALLGEQFPEVLSMIDDIDGGLLHLEVAAFRRSVEAGLDDGRLWYAERCFRFVNEILPHAEPTLANALEVSFIEDFALGEFTDSRRAAVKDRVPRPLRDKIVAINEAYGDGHASPSRTKRATF